MDGTNPPLCGTQGEVRDDRSMKNPLHRLNCLALVCVALAGTGGVSAESRVTSPSGEVGITVALGQDGVPTFAIDYLGRPLVLPSRIGVPPEFSGGFTFVTGTLSAHDGSWANPRGERRLVPARYRELSCELRHRSGRTMNLAFRAYDDGAALPAPSAKSAAPVDGRTEFRFPKNSHTWTEPTAVRPATREPVSKIFPAPGRSFTVQLVDGRFAALADARESPWQLLLIGRSAADLVARKDLALTLAPPAAFADTSWIKPGRVLRDFPLTAEGATAAVDYAQSVGIRYVCLDRRWSERGFDVPALARYARDRALGVIVTIDRPRQAHELTETFRQFAQWDVSGVEFARADTAPDDSAEWLAATAALSARHHLMVILPDARSAAMSGRTWPHVFAVSHFSAPGSAGAATANCTLPFTDGLFDAARSSALRTAGVTPGHRLALSVISSDPLATVAWNTRPISDGRTQDVEFLRRVPTVWDDTRILTADIGRTVVIARRTGEDWFVGAITGAGTRPLTLPLAFLDPDREYLANIYTDDSVAPSGPTQSHSYRKVFTKDKIDLPLLARGGAAIWLTPALKKR